MNRKTGIIVGLIVAITLVGVVVGYLLTQSDDEDEDVRHVAVVMQVSQQAAADVESTMLTPLKIEMTSLGYREGESIEYQLISGGTPDQLKEAVAATTGTDFDLVLAFGPAELDAVLQANLDAPRIFYMDRPAMSDELSDVLSDPDSDMTGTVLPFHSPKRLELLLEIDPSIKRIFMPYNPDDLFAQATYEAVLALEESFGVEIVAYPYTDLETFEQGMAAIPADVDAVFLVSTVETTLAVLDWSDECLRRHVPLSVGFGVPMGEALMGYGSDLTEVYETLAHQADRVLHGTDPNEMPVETVEITSYLHLGVADALGIEIPESALRKIPLIVRDPVSIPETGDALANLVGSCETTMNTPFGDFGVCFTQHCDILINRGSLNYLDKVEVSECTPAGMLGLCSFDGVGMSVYSGEVSTIASLCELYDGVWTAPE